jgi:hypothetical protein
MKIEGLEEYVIVKQSEYILFEWRFMVVGI